MLVAFCVLLAPLAITALVVLLAPKWWAWAFLLLALIPPVRVAFLLHRMFTSDAHISLASLYAPFVFAGLELVGLWIAWYVWDAQSAGEALAVAEGATAAYQWKKGRRVLGAVTGAGAVSQWQHSASMQSKPHGSKASDQPPTKHTTTTKRLTTRARTRKAAKKTSVGPLAPPNLEANSRDLTHILAQLAELHDSSVDRRRVRHR